MQAPNSHVTGQRRTCGDCLPLGASLPLLAETTAESVAGADRAAPSGTRKSHLQSRPCSFEAHRPSRDAPVRPREGPH